MYNRLRVRFCREFVAIRNQLLAERCIVVNFSVQQSPNRSIFITDGLATTRNVNDAQAAVTKADSHADINALVVRSTMTQRLVHPAYRFSRHRAALIEFEDSANSTHTLSGHGFLLLHQQIYIEIAIALHHT